MLIKNIKQQIYALAGLHQACLVVSNLAWRGEYNDKDFTSLINCITDNNSGSVEDIFVAQKYLQTGFAHLKKQIVDDIFTRSSETRRYISSIEKLVDKLNSSKNIINNISSELKLIDMNNTLNDKSKIISEIYQKTLSKIEPRIVVSGKNEYLQKEKVSSRIRTALFAGVRCVYLYREYGGNKIKFFLFKKSYINVLKDIINSN